MIVDAGVDVNHKDRDNQNALWGACLRTNDLAVFKALLKAGCDVSSEDSNLIYHYWRCCDKK